MLNYNTNRTFTASQKKKEDEQNRRLDISRYTTIAACVNAFLKLVEETNEDKAYTRKIRIALTAHLGYEVSLSGIFANFNIF